jgi:hypothetical protein
VTWHRSDDGFPEHPKSDALAEHFGDDWATCAVAFMAWHHMGCDCAARRTDGVFNASRARRVVRAPAEVVDRALAALVKVGFLDKHRDGFVFHDWAEYQPTRAELDAERAAKTERQKRWRENRPKKAANVDGHVDASTPPSVDVAETRDGGVRRRDGDGGVEGAPSRPVPTRPSSQSTPNGVLPPQPPDGGASVAKPTPSKRKAAKVDAAPHAHGTPAAAVTDALAAWPYLAGLVTRPNSLAAAALTTFPALDVIHEVNKAGGWCVANPEDAPRSKGDRFLWSWLQRAHEKSSRGAAAQSQRASAPDLFAPKPAPVARVVTPSTVNADLDAYMAGMEKKR